MEHSTPQGHAVRCCLGEDGVRRVHECSPVVGRECPPSAAPGALRPAQRDARFPRPRMRGRTAAGASSKSRSSRSRSRALAFESRSATSGSKPHRARSQGAVPTPARGQAPPCRYASSSRGVEDVVRSRAYVAAPARTSPEIGGCLRRGRWATSNDLMSAFADAQGSHQDIAVKRDLQVRHGGLGTLLRSAVT